MSAPITGLMVERVDSTQLGMINLMAVITNLSGLFHDIGKATRGFQAKLARSLDDNNRFESDVIRHECVSYIMLCGIENDAHLIEILTSSESVQDYFQQTMAAHLDRLHLDLVPALRQALDSESAKPFSIKPLTAPMSPKQFVKNPLMTALLWLVLNHHKSASIDRLSLKHNQMTINLNDYLNLKADSAKPEDFLTLSDNTHPWDQPNWCQSVAVCGQRLKTLMNQSGVELSGLNAAFPLNTPWVNLLTLCARPALVFADYYISKYAPIDPDVSGIDYANTKLDDEGVPRWADRLSNHLISVGAQAERLLVEVHAFRMHPAKQLPALDSAELPNDLLALNKTQGRYEWQYEAVNAIDQLARHQPAIKEQPAFIAVTSRTGSGKTRLAPAVMTRLSSSVRFTLGLGRRTLTMQSYQAYMQPGIGFAETDLALLMGEHINSPTEQNPSGLSGSDATDIDHDQYVIKQAEPRLHHQVLEGHDKALRLLNAPVSIMTIDQLVRNTYSFKSADFKAFHHIQHSDLILDEIDDYGHQDVVVLAKLIYLYGFFGRKVILCSATLPAIQIDALHHAFAEGARMREGVYGKAIPITHIAINDLAPFVDIHIDTPTEARAGYLPRYTTFIERVCEQLRQAPATHKIRTFELSDSYEGRHDAITDAVRELHDMNAIDASDVRLSIGFVRFNNVKEAQAYARHLNKTESCSDEVLIRVVCYHARMLNLDRHCIESQLDALLHRVTTDNQDPVLSHEVVHHLLSEARAKGMKEVIVIVSTTSIQETGRDHDYDWCLLEPLSSRSMVQAAGRVWRHRERHLGDHQANVGLMAHPIKALKDDTTDPSARIVYGYPGIESYGATLKPNHRGAEELKRHVPLLLMDKPNPTIAQWIQASGIACQPDSGDGTRLKQARALFAPYFFTHGIDAFPCLKPPTCYSDHPIEAMLSGLIASLHKNEAMTKFSALKSNTRESNILETLSSYTLRGDTKLNNAHGRHNQFRQQDGESFTLSATEDAHSIHYKSMWQLRNARGITHSIRIRQDDDSANDRMLFEHNQYTSEMRLNKVCGELALNQDQSESLMSMSIQTRSALKNGRLTYSSRYGLETSD